MAFFKFRKGGDERPRPAPAAESVEAMRKRAKHRLIGAFILVLLGVIGFPVLFDSQPRSVALDIPIEIPDKNKVKPLVNVPAPAPAASAAPASIAASESAPAPAPAPSAALAKVPAASAVLGERAVPQVTPVAPAPEKPVEKPVAKPDAAAKIQALLDGKEPSTALAGRFVVQIGAFADVLKAREARLKVEKAGLKTYTQVVQPKEGKRIRVRVGPFESKADAEKVAEKIKKLDLPASILEL